MSGLSERLIKAEVAVREAAADFSADIEAARDRDHAFALWQKLRELEDYLHTLGDRAAEREEEIARG